MMRVAQEESPPEGTSEESPEVQLVLAQITDVSLRQNGEGVQLVVSISDSSIPQVFQTQDGNILIIELENAQLADPNAAPETSSIDGVSSTTTQLTDTIVQIVIESTSQVPTAFLERQAGSLLLDIAFNEAVAAPPPEIPEETPEEIPRETAGDSGNTLRLVVTGDTEDGSDYSRPNASVGTRTDTPIIDVPQSIQVIPQEVLEAQSANTLNDAIRNASGVSAGRAISGARSATPLIRGFENNNNILRNGLRDDTLQFGSAIPNAERIEILKGPASVLFGAGDLGGTVNIVTESPIYEPRYEFEVNGGSFDEYGATLDFGGPLDDEDKLAYRLNIAYLGESSFIDFQDSDFLFVAPSFQVVNTEDTSLIFDFEYLRSRGRQSSSGLPAYAAIGLDNNDFVETFADSIADDQRQLAGTLDISTNVAEPSLGRSQVNITRVGYRLNHEFNDDWKLNHEFLGSFQETPTDIFVAGIAPFQAGGQTDITKVRRLLLSNPSERESYLFNTNIIGEFDVFGVDQTLLLGTEVSLEEERDIVVIRTELNPNGFDLFDPIYDPRGFEYFDLETATPNNDQVSNRNRYSFYGQTQLDFFSGRLIALLGGRLDIVDQDFRDFGGGNTDPDPIFINETAFSPRVGLVYKPADNVSLYASYSESFNPLAGQSAEGEVFDPERGQQVETGIKASFFDERLSTTLAYYNLTRSDVNTQDPINTGFQVQVGEQRSEGIEFDIAGEILPGWNMIANYAYTDALVTEDNEIAVGTRLINSPRNSASLWTTYQIQSGDLEGLGIGLGVYFVGDRNGELRRPFKVPSYTRTDASIFYEKDSFRTQLNIENLFDIRYFEGARDQFRVQPGSPFGVSASVSWEF